MSRTTKVIYKVLHERHAAATQRKPQPKKHSIAGFTQFLRPVRRPRRVLPINVEESE